MAANFWTSSHSKLLIDQDEVDMVPSMDKEKGLTLEDFKLIKIHMTNYIWKLAQLIKVRQRVIATAVTYFRRVYTRKSMSEYDPRLLAPTCLYLASKAEESTVQARLIVFYIKKHSTDEKYRFEVKDILEMEMKLLEALDYYLIVYHPYRSLIIAGCGMADLTHLSWGIVNDTYRMDLILIYAPFKIALACIYIATVLKEKDSTFMIKNISMEILEFYDVYKQVIPDDRIIAALNRLTSKA
ncbi:unnamed protein product [Spirodela intermedia]|uniref:Cyclin-like domain-containing protein n=1 Tax=Spirodela intermedia TaxID=51605 RepID=A0A7I8J1J6_SPIIN|nr:unnamed protein product [Spirodela intermedia]CAA6664094.1 unnamed protein product [Spirodela intermedia]